MHGRAAAKKMVTPPVALGRDDQKVKYHLILNNKVNCKDLYTMRSYK